MAGANLKLAGIDRFTKSHGYQEIYGSLDWQKKPNLSEDISEWGLYDNAVFEQAKIKLKEIHSSGKLFNLTIMTIDTHGPSGKVSRFCAQKGAKTLDQIVECSSEQTADFIKFIINNNYLEDTNIVIIGDHLLMGSALEDKLSKSSNRSIFNKFISDKPIIKNREEILHFDLFPTILEYINLSVSGNRLGLGYSAISKLDAFPPKNRYEEMKSKLLNYSDTYLDLWKNKSQ